MDSDADTAGEEDVLFEVNDMDLCCLTVSIVA